MKSAPVITVPLEERDRAFLRTLQSTMGGRMHLIRMYDRERAEACKTAGYCSIDRSGKHPLATITPRGASYLAKLRGVH